MQRKSDGFCSVVNECRKTTSEVGLPLEKHVAVNFIHMSKMIPSIATKFFLPKSTYLSLNTVYSTACSAEPAIYLLK